MGQQLSLKARALRLLGNREHSRLELLRKLAPHAMEPGQLEALLDDLQAKGFISEQRVVESLIHRRAGKLGVARIRQELQQKGLAPEMVSRAVAELQVSELARAHAVWIRKFARQPGTIQDASQAAGQSARQARFLAARGFSGETIRRVVKGEIGEE
jgi:regulatory protein